MDRYKTDINGHDVEMDYRDIPVVIAAFQRAFDAWERNKRPFRLVPNTQSRFNYAITDVRSNETIAFVLNPDTGAVIARLLNDRNEKLA